MSDDAALVARLRGRGILARIELRDGRYVIDYERDADGAIAASRIESLATQLAAAERRIAESRVGWIRQCQDLRAETIEECARVCDADFAEAPWREANELAMQIRQLVSTSERTDRGSS